MYMCLQHMQAQSISLSYMAYGTLANLINASIHVYVYTDTDIDMRMYNR